MGPTLSGKGYWVCTVGDRDALERGEEEQRFTDTNLYRVGETKPETER